MSSTIDTIAETAIIEGRAKRAGVTIKAILARADVASSQWQRWKKGQQQPLRTTWARVVAAAEEEFKLATTQPGETSKWHAQRDQRTAPRPRRPKARAPSATTPTVD